MDEFKKLGFGFMRLPETENAEGVAEIDIEQVKDMVDMFMDAGFTYFDTARVYHGGKSEGALKTALVDRYPRESFQVATKLPAWAAKDTESARALFDTSLEETGAGYFDYFLLHNLGEERTASFEKYGMWEFLAEKKAEGLIRNLGFSMHDKAELLEEILEAHPDMDFVQLQINYGDWENDIVESRKCYEVARAHNLPVIVMEPIKGGSLIKLPASAIDVLQEVNPDESLASWALRFPASLPGVIAVLSGMSTPEQVRENVAILDDFAPMTDVELDALAQVREILAGIDTVPCTDCRYCIKDCPQGIRIPGALISLNIMALYEDEHRAKEHYGWYVANKPASSCIGCGLCEAVCPQHIDIINQLERAAEMFEN